MTTITNTTVARIVVALVCLPCLFVLGGAASSSSFQCSHTDYDVLTKYHVDSSCDRKAQNAYERRRLVFQRAQHLHQASALSAQRGIPHVPNEKTITCPLAGVSSSKLSLLPSFATPEENDGRHLGFYTTWLVENTSLLPVVIAYVDHASGLEYSALNSDITPPQADPQAILMPRQFKSIRSMEGQVFHVYELLGEPGNYQLGQLVLQHRVGLIPIRNRHAPADALQCGGRNDPSPDAWQPNLQRTMANQNEHCNVVYRGFRNLVGCPLHAYYIGQSRAYQAQLATTGGVSAIPSEGGDSVEAMHSCPGQFKFHLGVNEQAKDFENDWDSTTKFETSFMSHTYVFRLARNTSIMVDSHTLTPTRVVDCPKSDTLVSTGRISRREHVTESVVLPWGESSKDDIMVQSYQSNAAVLQNVTTMAVASSKRNGTTSHEDCHGWHNHRSLDIREVYVTASASIIRGSHMA